MLLADLLTRLEGVKRRGDEYDARCPAHDDSKASLSLKNGEKGIVLHCHAGCTPEQIVTSMKLGMHDLFGELEPVGATIVATYPYVDENGLLLFEKRRFYPKKFRLRRPNGVGWLDTIDGARRVPYHLNDIVARPSATVWIAEGEKDADRLASCGLVATTNFEGGGGWKPDYADYLAGRSCIMLEDNDEVGRSRMLTVGLSLMGRATSIRALTFRDGPEHCDVSDWLDAGHSIDDLMELARAAPQWTPPKPEDTAPILETVRPFDVVATAPSWLIHGILARSKRMVIGGEPKAGKSLLALQAAISMALGSSYMDKWQCQQSTTLILSTEGGAAFASARIQQLCWGMHLDADAMRQVNERVLIVNRGRVDLTDKEGRAMLSRTVHALKPDALILDPLADLMSGDENDAEHMKPPCQAISDLLDELPSMAVVVVHHVSKAAKDKSLGYSLRGSSYLSGWYDSLLVARKLDSDLPRRLDGEHRYAIEPAPIGYRIEGGPGEVPDLPSIRLMSCDPPVRTRSNGVGRPVDVATMDLVAKLIMQQPGVWNRSRAAEKLGLERSTFNRYFDKLVSSGVLQPCSDRGTLYPVVA